MFAFFKRLRLRRKIHIDEGLNVVEGISKAKTLYKELIRKAHPDRHPQKEELAKVITEAINNNRYNYRGLLELKKRVETELI